MQFYKKDTLGGIEEVDPASIPIGGILTGDEIEKEIKCGRIIFLNQDGFNAMQINPNSYNLRISDKLFMYNTFEPNEIRHVIDLKDKSTFKNGQDITIPKSGYTLYPDRLYLANTMEIVGSNYYVPIITGRSSIGRLGITVHNEAGFGDLGYIGSWTLQLKVTYPTIIYPEMELCQMYFMSTCGEINKLYHGHYSDSTMRDKIQLSKFE